MHSLYLSDLINRKGWDPERVKLIRHVTSNERFKLAKDKKVIREYTQMQKANFYKNVDYVLVFIGDKGTTSKFLACYKVTGKTDDLKEELFSDYYPKTLLKQPYPDRINKFHELEETDYFKDLAERLYIDWGISRRWDQKGTNEKLIIHIGHLPKYIFGGYENIVLKFEDLEEILSDPLRYKEWHTALKSVHAIYLITLLDTGAQYIGSTSGKESILQRWSSYISTKHGQNKEIKDLLDKEPERYKKFQFSILQVIPKTMESEELFNLESLYKSKLRTREFGLNGN